MKSKQIYLWVIALYFVLISLFYYAAKEQLYERQSAGNISSVPGDRVTAELTEGLLLSQRFLCEMDKVERFSVNIATFARKNTGTLWMELWDDTEKKKIYSERFALEELIDGQVLEVVLSDAATGVRGHQLSIRMHSPGAAAGNAIAPWYASDGNAQGAQFYINESAADGRICFAVYGHDKVWTGPHYWKVTLPFGGMLCIACLLLLYLERKGKSCFVFTLAALMKRYRFLLKQLVLRDFKIKYRRSVLGALWSFINPLMTMCVQYIVFSTIFKMDIANYPVYLLSGVVFFNFFTESTNVAIHAITGNAGLITKVYVPKVIYPVSKVLSTGVNLLISLLPLWIMSLATGIRLTKAWLLLPYGLISLLLLSTGAGLLLSAVMVFFRDMQFIWSVLCMVFNYVTPVFYPVSILSEPMQNALTWNPLYHHISFFRTIILEGISPQPRLYVTCMLFSLGILAFGYAVFKKTQDRFIFYI